MFKYNVTFDNGSSAIVDSPHKINGMPKQSRPNTRHYKIVIPAYTKIGETNKPYGDFNPYGYALDVYNSSHYWTSFLNNFSNTTYIGRFVDSLGFGSTSRTYIISFEQFEGCDVDAANSRAEELLQLVGDKIVENAKAVGGTTFYYEKLWNQIYCISEDNRWDYHEPQEELVYAQFIAIRSVDGMMTLDEGQFRDYINRFNKHVGGPEPDFSEARFESQTEGESAYGPVFVGQSFIDAAAYGGMTDYFQDDPTYYYHFDIFF